MMARRYNGSVQSVNSQRGQIVFAMVLCLVPLMFLLFNIFNTGAIVANKTRLQNAADTTALVESAWVARSLNVMSMNNTALTQSHAITSTAFAIEGPVHRAVFTSSLILGFNTGRVIAYWEKLGKIFVGPIPVGAIIAGIISAIYAALAADLIEKVLKPMMDAIGEINRAYVDNQGFSRAAYGFARINEIIAEDSPAQITNYATSIAGLNYNGANVLRYYGWIDTPPKTLLEMPVADQGIQGYFGNSASRQQQNSAANNATGLLDYLEPLRDAWDIETSGYKGTLDTPYPDITQLNLNSLRSLSLDYFSNFQAQGYDVGTGPFSRTADTALREFNPVHQTLSAHADGRIDEIVRRAFEDKIDSVPCPKFLCSAIKKVVNFFLSPLLKAIGTAFGTIYEASENDLNKRLHESFQWASIYQESYYGWPSSVAGGKLAVSSTFGYVLALTEGRKLSNLVSIISDNAVELITDALEDTSDPAEEPETPEERDRRLDELLRGLEPDDIDPGGVTGQPGTGTSNSGTLDGALAEQTRAEQAQQDGSFGGSGDGSNTDGYEQFRKYVLWPYELAYIFISLPFPTDAIAYPLKFACAGDLGVGALCTNSTPLYAVKNPRILPDVDNYAAALNQIPGQIGQSFIGTLQSIQSGVADLGIVGTRREWSVLVGMHTPLEIPIWQRAYRRTPENISALAQAEVYNTQWYDLYTQSWRARLVPLSLLRNQKHLTDLKNSWSATTQPGLSTNTAATTFHLDLLAERNWDFLIRH